MTPWFHRVLLDLIHLWTSQFVRYNSLPSASTYATVISRTSLAPTNTLSAGHLHSVSRSLQDSLNSTCGIFSTPFKATFPQYPTSYKPSVKLLILQQWIPTPASTVSTLAATLAKYQYRPNLSPPVRRTNHQCFHHAPALTLLARSHQPMARCPATVLSHASQKTLVLSL